MSAYAITDMGAVRDVNEDMVAVGSARPWGRSRGKRYFAMVADGMGGHGQGEVASSIAVETISKCLLESTRPASQILLDSFRSANARIWLKNGGKPLQESMGTTCTTLVFEEGAVYLAHVGDSRAYRYREGDIVQLSEDHSLVAQLLKSNLISDDEAGIHPDKNVVMKAMGLEENMTPDSWTTGLEVQAGDVYCLCSDGLHNSVDDQTIAEILSTLRPHAACTALRDLALETGGDDNVSICVMSAVNVKIETRQCHG